MFFNLLLSRATPKLMMPFYIIYLDHELLELLVCIFPSVAFQGYTETDDACV